MSASFAFDPLRLVLTVFNDLYPQAPDCVVYWTDEVAENGAWGSTHVDETPIAISISVDLPIAGAVEVLAHELAHVAAGFDAGHGPEWEATFAAIHAEYVRRVEESE